MNFWRGRRVLLTGHTGFKGAWMNLWLETLGADVTGLALAPEQQPNLYTLLNLASSSRSILGDIRDLPTVETAIAKAKPEVIIHMAAQALVRRSYREPVATYATNVLGTAHVLDAARRLAPDLRALVVVTSDKCYENREQRRPYVETDPMGGHDPYSSSKGCAELVTASFRDSFFTANMAGVASVRAGNVIGGGDWAEDRLIPDIVRACLEKKETVLRNPEATRPWQHVLEPLAGYLRLAELLAGSDGHRFASAWNFGPPSECHSVRQIVSQMADLWPGLKWRVESQVEHEAQTLQLDSAKAREKLGWKPKLSLREALEWTVRWYRCFAKEPSNSSELRQETSRQIREYMAT